MTPESNGVKITVDSVADDKSYVNFVQTHATLVRPDQQQSEVELPQGRTGTLRGGSSGLDPGPYFLNIVQQGPDGQHWSATGWLRGSLLAGVPHAAAQSGHADPVSADHERSNPDRGQSDLRSQSTGRGQPTRDLATADWTGVAAVPLRRRLTSTSAGAARPAASWRPGRCAAARKGSGCRGTSPGSPAGGERPDRSRFTDAHRRCQGSSPPAAAPAPPTAAPSVPINRRVRRR